MMKRALARYGGPGLMIARALRQRRSGEAIEAYRQITERLDQAAQRLTDLWEQVMLSTRGKSDPKAADVPKPLAARDAAAPELGE